MTRKKAYEKARARHVKELSQFLNRLIKENWEYLRRNPHYRRDWDATFNQFARAAPQNYPRERLTEEFLTSPEGQALARRYGLEMPYHYQDPVWEPDLDPLPPVFQETAATAVVPHAPTATRPGSDEEILVDCAPHLKDGRFLTIRIDITRTDELIFSELKSHLWFYREVAEAAATKAVRDKFHYDPLEMWDYVMTETGGRLPSETELKNILWRKAQEIEAGSKKENAPYTHNIYAQLRRAFHYALQQIARFNP